MPENQTPAALAAPVAADVAGKASKELATVIRKAREEFKATTTAARIKRDTDIAAAYHRFSEVTGTTA